MRSVELCADGHSALEALRERLPDALLLDLRLPGLSGIDVLHRLTERQTKVQVIAMTGYDHPDRIAEAEGLGVDAVLRKPFDVAELLRRLSLSDHRPDLADEGESARIAVLAQHPLDLGHALRRTIQDCFGDADLLREAVADHPYDAAIVFGGGSEDPQLLEDLKFLDDELGVLTAGEPRLVQAGIERTRRRRAQAAELARLRTLVRRLPIPLLVIRGDPPAVHSWNDALLGQTLHRGDEIDGTLLSDLQGSESPSAFAALVREARRKMRPEQGLVTVRIRGGPQRPFLARVAPIDGTGASLCITLRASDQRAEARPSARLMSATAAGVAHEMRNTLAAVSSSLSVIVGRMDEGDAAQQLIDRVLERIGRAKEVMEDLLDYARPLAPNLKPVPVRMVLKAAADQVRAQAPDGVTVLTELEDPSLRILADPVRLQLALINLGNNAVQALRGNGSVRFSCSRGPDGIDLCVDDDGPGIESALHEQIFEPFFTTRTNGSGLGLANVRKVAEAHGGTAELLTRDPGGHFRIRLPPRLPSPEDPS